MGSGAARVGCSLYLVLPLCCSSLGVLTCQVQEDSRLPHVSSGAALGESASPAEHLPVQVLPDENGLGFLVVATNTGHTETGTVKSVSGKS